MIQTRIPYVVACCTAIALWQQVPAQPQPSDKASEERAQWTEALRKGLAEIEGPVLIDLPLPQEAIHFRLEKGSGFESLARLAWVFDRDLQRVKGAAVLARKPAAASVDELSDSAALLALLETLSPSHLNALAADGLALGELPPQGQQAFARLASANAGISEKIVAGDFVHVKLFPNPVAEYVDPRTNRRGAASLASYSFASEAETQRRQRVEDRWKETRSEQGGDTLLSPGADLDFGEGETMTLRELVDRLRLEVGMTVSFDQRLDPAPVFLKGVFSREQITEAVVNVARAQQPVMYPWSRENRHNRISSLLGLLKGGTPVEELDGIGSLTAADIGKGASFTAKSLAEQSAYFSSLYQALGLPPQTEMTTAMRLGVAMYAHGLGLVPGGSRGPDGVLREVRAPNVLRFRIDP